MWHDDDSGALQTTNGFLVVEYPWVVIHFTGCISWSTGESTGSWDARFLAEVNTVSSPNWRRGFALPAVWLTIHIPLSKACLVTEAVQGLMSSPWGIYCCEGTLERYPEGLLHCITWQCGGKQEECPIMVEHWELVETVLIVFVL